MRLPHLDIGSLVARFRRNGQGSSASPLSRGISSGDAELAVRDGDVLLWRGSALTSLLFRVWSKNWYSHVAFVVHWEGQPMILQADAYGIQAVPFRRTVEKYKGRVDWYLLTDPARQTLNLRETIREATGNLGLPFGLLHALRELAFRKTGFRLFSKRSNYRSGMFCAEYVSRCFKKGGLDLLPAQADIHTLPDDVKESGFFRLESTIADNRRGIAAWWRALRGGSAPAAGGGVPTLPLDPPTDRAGSPRGLPKEAPPAASPSGAPPS